MNQPTDTARPAARAGAPRREFANVDPDVLVPGQRLPVPPHDASIADWLLCGHQGQGVRVCLIDSGVEFSHPEIRNTGVSYTVESGQDDVLRVVATDDLDVVGHGTACASVISRVAPYTTIDSIRVLGPENRGSGETLLAALDWAISAGYHIVNLSLSTRRPANRGRLLELAEAAANAGVLLVCSAHNSPVESYPWVFTSVISVGSHDRPDAYEVHINPRPPVDFYAGGVGVHVAWLGGTTRTVSGNSFATPAIVANLARVIEGFPGLRAWQYKYLLSLLATNVRRSIDD